METLRESAASIGLNAANPLQSQESVCGEPLLGPLRYERIESEIRLSVPGRWIEPHKKVRRSQIAIILGNLVFQDQMIAKRVPCQFADHPVVLVQVVPVVRQDQVRNKLRLQFFELIFDP